MYEGKNVHYSPVDQKPLCSFSGKVCNQRRLNKYGFCVRHILEDPNAPFKRCAYVAKSSRQTCTQPIPKNEEREYCNNHMQVLGMLPKKARKPKKEKIAVPTLAEPFNSQPGSVSVPLLLHSRNKPKLTVSGFKSKHVSGKISAMADMEDVYAFPADVSDNINKSNVSTMITSVAIQDLSASSKAVTYSTFTTNTKSSEGAGSHSSLAKIYPELAEKLEKIKPKLVDPKLKGKVKSSRTMNSLQSKIAQNKIKDKLKRNQSSSNASSQSQSPSHGFTNVNSPGCRVSPASSPNLPLPVSSPSVVHSSQTPRSALETSSAVTNCVSDQPSSLNASATNLTQQQTIHGLNQFNLVNSLNLQSLNSSLAQLGFPVPAASDIEQILQQLAKAANIPLESAPTQSDGKSQSHASQSSVVPGVAGLAGAGFPRQPDLLGVLKPSFISLSGPPPPYSSIHHKPGVSLSHSAQSPAVSVSLASSGAMCVTDSVKSSVSSATSMSASSMTLQRPSLSEGNISKVVPSEGALSSTLSLTSSSSSSSPEKKSFTTPSAAMLPPLVSTFTSAISSKIEPPQKPLGQTPLLYQGKTKADDVLEHNVSNVSASKQRPPKLKSRSRNNSALSKRPVPVFTLPITLVKPQKIRKLLSDEESKKFKEKSAISYYKKFKLRKECNHDLIISGFDSSDESDLSDCDMLPWQPGWFKASSDEECCDEDESDYDLRPTKLALARAQLRRQCFQARQSYRANLSVCEYNNDSTSTLIQAAKNGARHAVSALNEINGKLHKPVDRYKTRGLDRRQCLYKDNDEVQCKGNVVPYTNHCIKHVMYNVDQQLFEYCTAKFADNTQCCHPVIDLKHELPLCMEHGLKADNFLKIQESEPKPKRPRKKTKPSALTRPPKKGKKKKNQRKSAQQPIAVSKTDEETAGAQDSEDEPHGANDSENEAVDMEDDDGDEETEMEEPDVQSTAPSKSALLKASSASVSKSLADETVKLDSKPIVIDTEGKSGERKISASQLEELENLAGLQELDNVKMFGDLPLENASKLLEENDFQEVLNRLPDEAFDLFNKTSSLPSNEELDELEKSLAMANRDLRYAKDSMDNYSAATADQGPSAQIQQQTSTLPPILDDADELTRQIAEEILKQNIGTDSGGNESSVCNGDAQESIKAIARSLSTSGMLLTSDLYQSSQNQEHSVIPSVGVSLSRSQPVNATSAYSSLGQVFNPPNVALQSLPKAQPIPAPNPSNTAFGLAKGQAPVSSPGLSNFIPRNYAAMQGGFQGQLPSSTHSNPQFSVSTSLNTSAIASSLNTALPRPNSTAGAVNFPGGQHITAHQLSQIVQQAGLQLPPVPPYVPRQSTSSSQGVALQHNVTITSQQPMSLPYVPRQSTSSSQEGASQHAVTVTSQQPTSLPYVPRQSTPSSHGVLKQHAMSVTSQQPVPSQILQQPAAISQQQQLSSTAPSAQTMASQLSHQQQLQAQQQQLARQRDQLTQQQQHLLTQQLLQQHLLALAQQQVQQNQLAANLQQQLQASQAKAQPLLTPNVNISALLQQGQKFNHIPTMSSSSGGSVTIPQLIKANFLPQQPAATSTVLTQVSLPTANIVWTAPPNVTITSSNGFSRNVIPGSTSSGIGTSTVGTSVDSRAKQEDTVIDLTDSNDPPAYPATEKVFTSQPPSSFLSKAVSSSRGKS